VAYDLFSFSDAMSDGDKFFSLIKIDILVLFCVLLFPLILIYFTFIVSTLYYVLYKVLRLLGIMWWLFPFCCSVCTENPSLARKLL
jgi:hypothetical protein